MGAEEPVPAPEPPSGAPGWPNESIVEFTCVNIIYIYMYIVYCICIYGLHIIIITIIIIIIVIIIYIYINILSNYIIIYISYLFNIHMGVATANARKPLKGSYNFKPSVATGPFGPEITILQTCAGQLSITHLQKNTKELDPQINQ